ncbi:MAG: type II toxin-antitoxin system PemK/MazF family toxin [Draconibacterium sp.]|nr:type II toxin-antitoxin system PemK/MazF family toxin [Draconibacterium sp.]
MERFVKADIVVVSFPFSDLSNSKKRPALVLADLIGDDVILYQITSKNVNDIYSIPLISNDFSKGRLHKPSNIRPSRLFTADKNIIHKKVGKIKSEKYFEVSKKIYELIQL